MRCVEGNVVQEGDRKERYHSQTREQFEALGRFVQAFELLVFGIRGGLESRLQRESANMVYFTRMLFHHSVLTAGPLWEMLRAVIYTDVSELHPIDPNDSEAFDKAPSKIGKEVTYLTKARNNILHGTPFIGWCSSEQEDFLEMNILKWGVSGKGWKEADTPKSAADLLALVERCEGAEKAVRYVSVASWMPEKEQRDRYLGRAIDALQPSNSGA